MKYILLLFFSLSLLFWAGVSRAYAVVDPLALPNNKAGIHILFPEELSEAAKLVNSNGGAWGYVIIPIQSGDKNLPKWQKFMDDAKQHKVIPIIRIATEGDYFNTRVWRKPTEADILDFANFLSSLSWPTKNKYIAVFNEVNRADEWGGEVNPSEYAQLLSYAVTVFKSKNQDFFIISAGFDNASANTGEAMNQYDYMRAMNTAVPNIFSQVDGLGTHSYPNPAFAQPPSNQGPMSIASYRHQQNLITQLGGRILPVFITETGWSTQAVDPETAASYFYTAFTTVWSDQQVVAVTPFILKSGHPFDMFSFIHTDGSPTPTHTTYMQIQKTKGSPILEKSILGDRVPPLALAQKDFTNTKVDTEFAIPPGAKTALKWFLKMPL